MVRGWWYKEDEHDVKVWRRVEGEGMVVQGSLTRHACAGRMEGEVMVVQGRCRTEK